MEECVDHNVKTDVEHFQNIYSSICSIVSEIARIQDFNQKKACQEAVGRFLQFSVDFCRLAGSTRPEIMPTAYSILTQLTKVNFLFHEFLFFVIYLDFTKYFLDP